MPVYRVDVTVTFPAWYVTEAENEQEAIEYARGLRGSDFNRDDATMEYTVDGVVIDDD